MAPKEVKGPLPKDSTPVTGVSTNAPPIPASNTKSLSFSESDGKVKAKETQPLVIPDNVQWTPPQTVKPKTSKGFKEGQKALVTFVQDGDTASLTTKGENPVDINCRLDKIDAPETGKKGAEGQPYGKESKLNLQRLIDQKEVSVSVSYAKDDWGRNLCQIEVDGADVSLKQLEDGYAWLYRRYGNPLKFDQAHAQAQQQRKGLFADKDAEHPRNFKH